MTITGCDSKPPSSSSIAKAVAAGVDVWAGYIGDPGDGIAEDHLWSKSDFDRVKAAGLATFAYVSGNQDPVKIAARGASYGVKIGVDVERFIRPDGAWVQPWLDKSGAGLYGNLPVHGGRKALFHIVAAYPTVVPTTPSTWLPGVARPSGPCAWQYRGTHTNYAAVIDSLWLDDWFLADHLGTLGSQEERMVLFHVPATDPVVAERNKMYVVDASGKRWIQIPEFAALQRLGQGDHTDVAAADLAKIPNIGTASAPFDPAPLLSAIADVKAAVTNIKVTGTGVPPEIDVHLQTIEAATAKLEEQFAAGLKVDLIATAKP